jgi:hypothetical protein
MAFEPTQEFRPRSKVNMDANYESRFRDFMLHAEDEAQRVSQGRGIAWFRPGDWDGDLSAARFEEMSEPFLRQDLFNEFSETVSPASKEEPPGTVGDIIAATTMAETLSVMERALRMRHTMRRIRATCHLVGRKKAHGSDTGPFLQSNVEYLRGLLKQSRQVKGA